MAQLNIISLETGPLSTNCYIVHREGSQDCAIIDPGGDGEKIAAAVDERRLSVRFLLLTHSHFDHIAALEHLRERFPAATIACHAVCNERMQSPQLNLGFLIGVTVKGPPADRELAEGEVVDQDDLNLKVLHIPGHAPGHLVYHDVEDGVVFSGDTLFQGSLGRTDFEGASYEDLTSNINSKLLCLPDETQVYPGHGEATTIGSEKKSNPFIRDILAN